MKNNRLHLVAKGGYIGSFKDKEEAFKSLGSDFIKKYVGFELRVMNHDSHVVRSFLQETSSYITNKWMRDGKKRYGEVFREIFPQYYEYLHYYGSYMLINDFNEIFCICDFKDLVLQERRNKRNEYNRSKKFWNGNGAVPGTGVGRRRAGWAKSIYKFPKTVSMMKEAFDVVDDEFEIQEPPIRNKLKMVIRDVWDELPRTDRKNNNWKRYRRNQYKSS